MNNDVIKVNPTVLMTALKNMQNNCYSRMVNLNEEFINNIDVLKNSAWISDDSTLFNEVLLRYYEELKVVTEFYDNFLKRLEQVCGNMNEEMLKKIEVHTF